MENESLWRTTWKKEVEPIWNYCQKKFSQEKSFAWSKLPTSGEELFIKQLLKTSEDVINHFSASLSCADVILIEVMCLAGTGLSNLSVHRTGELLFFGIVATVYDFWFRVKFRVTFLFLDGDFILTSSRLELLANSTDYRSDSYWVLPWDVH